MSAVFDISGYSIFSGSELGQAHVVAHRMLDLGRPAHGRLVLGKWLEGRDGEGSEWVHLQWHMLVFELALGDWEKAHRRFLRHVLPAARDTDEAVCDAPAGLWHLAMSATAPVALPWEDVASRARTRLRRERPAYSELHDLLALAGARDAHAIDAWITERERAVAPDETLLGFSRGFRALANDDPHLAANELDVVLPELSTLGGSRAQNELFHQIHASLRSAQAALAA